MAEKITDRLVRATRPPSGKHQIIVWDTLVKGFGLRVTENGAATFIFNYRAASGRAGQCKIGRAGQWTKGPDGGWRFEPGAWEAYTARKGRGEERGAEALKRIVDSGGDPQQERQASRESPTIKELCERYVEDHAKRRKRGGSLAEDEGLIRQWLVPELGSRKVADLRRPDVDKFHRRITDAGTPIRANRAVALLSTMMGLAVRWELRADNPAKGASRNPENQRQRYLTPDELKALLGALAKDGDKDAANVVRLLLLTGARRGEALSATWDQFDLSAGIWHKPASATKQGKPHHVPLSAPALKVLSAMRVEADAGEGRARQLESEAAKKGLATHAREAKLNAAGRARLLSKSPFLFPGYGGDGPLNNITRYWRDLTKRAKLRDFRIHDLRHSYASLLVSSGLSLEVIGALLGHTQAQTTRRYSHLMLDPLRAATDRVGALVDSVETGKTAEVKAFPKGAWR